MLIHKKTVLSCCHLAYPIRELIHLIDIRPPRPPLPTQGTFIYEWEILEYLGKLSVHFHDFRIRLGLNSQGALLRTHQQELLITTVGKHLPMSPPNCNKFRKKSYGTSMTLNGRHAHEPGKYRAMRRVFDHSNVSRETGTKTSSKSQVACNHPMPAKYHDFKQVINKS